MNHEKLDKIKQNKSTEFDKIIRKIHCKKFTNKHNAQFDPKERTPAPF